jgi:amino acid permease
MKHIFYLIFISSLALPAFGQTQATLSTPPSWQPDNTKKDTAVVYTGSQNTPDKDKIKIVKRKIDYRNFVILAIGMMVFVALILGTTQAWNPGGRTP